jgi:hypothetical protein
MVNVGIDAAWEIRIGTPYVRLYLKEGLMQNGNC